MAVKTVLVLCACVALAFGAAIESRARRQVNQAQDAASGMMNNIPGASAAQGFGNMASSAMGNIPGASGAQGFGNMASSAMKNIPGAAMMGGFKDAAKGIGNRVQNAFNQTYQEERNSVSDSFNSVKDKLHQNIETGANLTKTAFDLGTIVPKFGKNLVIGGSN